MVNSVEEAMKLEVFALLKCNMNDQQAFFVLICGDFSMKHSGEVKIVTSFKLTNYNKYQICLHMLCKHYIHYIQYEYVFLALQKYRVAC